MDSDKKYGVVMLGVVNGQAMIIAPWVQGRYSSKPDVAFNLGKGDADKSDTGTIDEIRKTAAVREFGEETGIWIKPDDTLRGKDDKKIEGVEILRKVKIDPQQYPSNSGNPTDIYLDVVVVSNIEKLGKHLKGSRLNSKFQVTETAEQKAVREELPSFEELITRMHDLGLPDTIKTEAQFDTYVNNTRSGERSEWTKLLRIFRNLRDELVKQYPDKLGDGKQELKIDKSFNPPRYIQEGAECLPIDVYFDMIKNFGGLKPDAMAQAYRNSMLGRDGIPGQLAAVETAFAHDEVQKLLKQLGMKPETPETIDADKAFQELVGDVKDGLKKHHRKLYLGLPDNVKERLQDWAKGTAPVSRLGGDKELTDTPAYKVATALSKVLETITQEEQPNPELIENIKRLITNLEHHLKHDDVTSASLKKKPFKDDIIARLGAEALNQELQQPGVEME